MKSVFGPPTEQPFLPGVRLDRIAPGGKNGPDDAVLSQPLGNMNWMYEWKLGTPDDAFQLAIPDIRMPPNQIWPLHWHDCWVAVIVVDGCCLIGDWWMQPGDVLIAKAELEYGPVVAGPEGVQLFEIFAQSHLRQGGYAPEYRDHPTVQGMTAFRFKERSPLNKRNEGRSSLPNAGVDGIVMGHLTPGAVFDLGEAGDPDRGLMVFTRFEAGQDIAPHTYDDARAIFVFDGDLTLGDRQLAKGDALIIERGAAIPAVKAGPKGAQLLEIARTSAGVRRRLLETMP
jgi:quercetin dioxygenase-like cupin family protein